MKTRSQAGRDHCKGDQIIVPKEVTRSSRMWLSMPAAYIAVSAAKEGACHFREFANRRVMAARSRAQSGSIKSECVMLRCQVMIRSRSLEKISRHTSESGKIAPSIIDQVIMRPRFIGCDANRSSPRKTAFPINAPAMPWVIVSISESLPDARDPHDSNEQREGGVSSRQLFRRGARRRRDAAGRRAPLQRFRARWR